MIRKRAIIINSLLIYTHPRSYIEGYRFMDTLPILSYYTI
jgi:hypothetical protein